MCDTLLEWPAALVLTHGCHPNHPHLINPPSMFHPIPSSAARIIIVFDSQQHTSMSISRAMLSYVIFACRLLVSRPRPLTTALNNQRRAHAMINDE